MIDVLAEIPDLEAALGRQIESSEVPRAQRELGFASGLASSLAPWKLTEWTAGAPDEVKFAVAGLAARRFSTRTDGLVAIGPFRYAETSQSGVSGFTRDELGMLGVPDTSDTFSIARPDE